MHIWDGFLEPMGWGKLAGWNLGKLTFVTVHVHICLIAAAASRLDVGDLVDDLHGVDGVVQLLLLLQLDTGPSISKENLKSTKLKHFTRK